MFSSLEHVHLLHVCSRNKLSERICSRNAETSYWKLVVQWRRWKNLWIFVEQNKLRRKLDNLEVEINLEIPLRGFFQKFRQGFFRNTFRNTSQDFSQDSFRILLAIFHGFFQHFFFQVSNNYFRDYSLRNSQDSRIPTDSSTAFISRNSSRGLPQSYCPRVLVRLYPKLLLCFVQRKF